MTDAAPGNAAIQGLATLVLESRYGSTADAVMESLREAIITGALPPDTWLREDVIAARLAVSRTPVREAFRRLSDEGLTRRTANRGTVVAPMSIDELINVYELREALEGIAARRAAQRRDPGLIRDLRRVHQAMIDADHDDVPALAQLNLEFHRLLRTDANPLLDRFLQQVEYAVRRFPFLPYSSKESAQLSHDDHGRIVDAIASGDPEAAQAAAVDHLQRIREVRLQQLLRR